MLLKFITLTPIIVERDREVATMRRFKQLSRADRLKIEALLKAGREDLIGYGPKCLLRHHIP